MKLIRLWLRLVTRILALGVMLITSEARAGFTGNQLTTYLRDHPEMRHQSAALLVWQAIAKAFPQGAC